MSSVSPVKTRSSTCRHIESRGYARACAASGCATCRARCSSPISQSHVDERRRAELMHRYGHAEQASRSVESPKNDRHGCGCRRRSENAGHGARPAPDTDRIWLISGSMSRTAQVSWQPTRYDWQPPVAICSNSMRKSPGEVRRAGGARAASLGACLPRRHGYERRAHRCRPAVVVTYLAMPARRNAVMDRWPL